MWKIETPLAKWYYVPAKIFLLLPRGIYPKRPIDKHLQKDKVKLSPNPFIESTTLSFSDQDDDQFCAYCI
jgi:hypothetical protein